MTAATADRDNAVEPRVVGGSTAAPGPLNPASPTKGE